MQQEGLMMRLTRIIRLKPEETGAAECTADANNIG
jgi:hypothetical protein